MKYTESLSEDARVAIVCDLIKELGFGYEVYRGKNLGGIMVDVMILREPPRFLKKERRTYCAVIDLTFFKMYVYGDDYKQVMIDLAQKIEENLLGWSNLQVEFKSDDTITCKIPWLRLPYWQSSHQAY